MIYPPQASLSTLLPATRLMCASWHGLEASDRARLCRRQLSPASRCGEINGLGKVCGQGW